jgi:predicted TIM-barrel fold metal-dependent hydrolase
LVPVVQAWPQVTFVLTHIGYRLSADAVQTVLLCPNVMLETSENWDDIIGSAFRRVSAARVVFGSNYPFSTPGFERLKVGASPWLSDAEKEQVLGATAARVFGLAF